MLHLHSRSTAGLLWLPFWLPLRLLFIQLPFLALLLSAALFIFLPAVCAALVTISVRVVTGLSNDVEGWDAGILILWSETIILNPKSFKLRNIFEMLVHALHWAEKCGLPATGKLMTTVRISS